MTPGLRAGIATLGLVVIGLPALAQNALSKADAEPYLGTWTLSADFNGNPINMTLEIALIEDEVKAAMRAIISPQPQLIDEVAKAEMGIDLAWEADLGGNAMRVHIKAVLEDDKLIGTFGDESGFFTAEFTGEREAEAADIVLAAAAAAAEKDSAPQTSRRFGGTTVASYKFGDAEVSVAFGKLELESVDHRAFVDTAAGSVYSFPGSRCFKLQTEAELHFGDTVVAAHNFGPDYPGTYSLWLKKSKDGWSLVFNEEADVWGTMHNPGADVGEVALEIASLDQAANELTFEVVAGASGGRIKVAWGETEWSAPFRIQ
ncbi:MAG: DUF2911 domain-containing protein [Acidobacteriota bacterium]|nr:DUF2911 domain-containing protein [Acidobacteriota bacterium]